MPSKCWLFSNQKFWFRIQSHARLEEKHIHLGFVVWGKDCQRGVEATVKHSWTIYCRPGEITRQAAPAPLIVKIATGPQIIQSLKHFLPSSSNSPASVKWLQQSCLFHKTFPNWNRGNSLWTPLYINTQFPWFPYNSQNALALWSDHNANPFMLRLFNARCFGSTAFISCRPFWSIRSSTSNSPSILLSKASYTDKYLSWML